MGPESSDAQDFQTLKHNIMIEHLYKRPCEGVPTLWFWIELPVITCSLSMPLFLMFYMFYINPVSQQTKFFQMLHYAHLVIWC